MGGDFRAGARRVARLAAVVVLPDLLSPFFFSGDFRIGRYLSPFKRLAIGSSSWVQDTRELVIWFQWKKTKAVSCRSCRAIVDEEAVEVTCSVQRGLSTVVER